MAKIHTIIRWCHFKAKTVNSCVNMINIMNIVTLRLSESRAMRVTRLRDSMIQFASFESPTKRVLASANR